MDTNANTPWVAIQRNRSSGSGQNARSLLDLIRHLRQRGITPRLYARREDFDAAVRNPSRRPHLIAIVAAGGDGTVLDLVNRHADLPICVFPLGTENLLAKFLGIPRCGQTTAEIITRGHRSRFDLGRWNGRRFLIMVSSGIDAEIVHEVQLRRHGGHIRHWSYVIPILKSVWNYRPRTIRLTGENPTDALEGELVIVANFNSYAMNLNLAPTALGNDGKLNAWVFQIRSRFQLLRHFFAVIRGSHTDLPTVTCLTGKRFRIESSFPSAVQVDGDAAGETPVEIGIEPLAVEFLVPEP